MKNCIFCSIINKEIPVDTVYEDNSILAFRDINPQAKIHIIIIPKTCRLYFHETEDDILIRLFQAIKIIVSEQELDCDGYRIVNNNGMNGGQTVSHIHLHILGGELLSNNFA